MSNSLPASISWRGIPRRVVVHHDDGGAARADGLAEKLTDAHLGGVDAALVDLGHGQHLILGVQQDDAHVLLLQQPHLRQEEVGHVLRGADGGPLLRLSGDQAEAQLQGSLHLGGLGLAHAVLSAQLAEAGPHQAGQAAETGQRGGGQRQGVLGRGAGAQDDGQQLGVAEGRSPVVAQSLPRALGRRQLTDGGSILDDVGHGARH
jgi:hypothetical protein